jgi:Leucine-rich repeat (LRR) protein
MKTIVLTSALIFICNIALCQDRTRGFGLKDLVADNYHDKCEITLNVNDLKEGFPEEVYQFENVVSLKLFGITENGYPDNRLLKLTKLKNIRVSFNYILEDDTIKPNSFFPDIMLMLPSLEILNIEGYNRNFIENFIPDKFDNLRSLKKLTIYSSNISTFPTSICNLDSLQELQLLGIDTTVYPVEIENLSNLKTLIIINNGYKKLPHELPQLTFSLEKMMKLEKLQLVDFATGEELGRSLSLPINKKVTIRLE